MLKTTEERLDSLEKSMSQFEQTHRESPSGIPMDEDSEYFDQGARLEYLEFRLEALIRVLEESNPGLRRKFDLEHKVLRSAASPDPGTAVDEALDVAEEGPAVFGLPELLNQLAC